MEDLFFVLAGLVLVLPMNHFAHKAGGQVHGRFVLFSEPLEDVAFFFLPSPQRIKNFFKLPNVFLVTILGWNPKT